MNLAFLPAHLSDAGVAVAVFVVAVVLSLACIAYEVAHAEDKWGERR